jgi:putative DNA primase/helicase
MSDPNKINHLNFRMMTDGDLAERFIMRYGEDLFYDTALGVEIPVGALKLLVGRDMLGAVLKHKKFRILLPEQFVFDPAGDEDVHSTINLYRGLTMQPGAGSCRRLLELLEFLCSGQSNAREIFDWIIAWLAYPLKHPGAKMQTALLMHGPEGAGKNLFFSAIAAIYGEYASMIGQLELESQFTDWLSRKLFIIANEVVTRAELYHQQGRLKALITDSHLQINEKFRPRRLERNHANFVFFSNRIDIAKLDRDDRRYAVIWTPAALGQDFYDDVAVEIAAGGAAALYSHLRALNLGDFGPHTKPPMTLAKRELINLGLDSTDRFWLEWAAGKLPAPFVPCKSLDLYSVYRLWAQREGVPRAAPSYVLLSTVGKKPGVRKAPRWFYEPGTSKKVQQTVVNPPDQVAPDGETDIAWLSKHVAEFAEALEAWKGAGK